MDAIWPQCRYPTIRSLASCMFMLCFVSLYFQEWSSLNYMYGVVNVSFHEKENLIAHLEFEPGLYTNHQMKVFLQDPHHDYFSLIDILGHKKWILKTEGSDVWMGWRNISKQWYKAWWLKSFGRPTCSSLQLVLFPDQGWQSCLSNFWASCY